MNPKDNPKKAVITGVNGFVGSHLAKLLIDKGYDVHGIVRATSNLQWLENLALTLHTCGLKNKDQLATVFKDASYIFHIAGIVTARSFEEYYQGNVVLTQNVLEAAHKANTKLERIVITSSLAVAGPAVNNIPVTEDMPYNPLSSYGRAKVAQEQLAKKYYSKLPITILRPPPVYGERDTQVLLFFKTISKGFFTTIGWGEKYLSMVHIQDLIRGLLLAATKANALHQTYFLGSEKQYNWKEIGKLSSKVLQRKTYQLRIPHTIVYGVAAISQLIAGIRGKAAVLNLEKAREVTQTAWMCSSEKAVQELGYQQQISLEEGLERTLDWYKKEKWL